MAVRAMAGWSIAGRLFLVQLVAVLLSGGLILLMLWVDARRSADDDAAQLSLAISEAVAVDPAVTAAIRSPDPTAALQPYATQLVRQDRVDFVTIMDPGGIRWTHPDPAQIGRPFLGTITQAQAGRSLTETYTGTLGPSVRAVVPILDGGRVIGIVSAGVTTERVSESLLPRLPFVLGVAVLVVAIGSAAAWLGRRGVRRVTGRMSERELQRMVQFYESVLHSVREGVVLTDDRRRVVLYNDEAADLLGLPPAPADPSPTAATELGIDAGIAALLDSGRRVVEEAHVAGDRVLLVNQEPATAAGAAPATGPQSSVMTLRDQSRLARLAGELESVRTMTDALRAQTHEHANTLHTVVSLLQLGRVGEATELIAASTRTSQRLTDAVLATVSDPVLAALLLGKAAQAGERGVAFEVVAATDAALPLPPAGIVSVVGNLVDNALEAALAGHAPRGVEVRIATDADAVLLSVTDSGDGLDAAGSQSAFERGVTSKSANGHGVGLAVVREIVTAHGGTVAFAAGRPTTVVVRLPAGRRG